MEKFSVSGATIAVICFVAMVSGHPADHREDTVLPFSLSPGNVNLETYYLDKYPKPGSGSGGRLNREPEAEPAPLAPEENMFAYDDTVDAHALFRSRRDANPQHHHHHDHHHHNPPSYHHHHPQPSYHHHHNFGHVDHHNPHYSYGHHHG